MGATKVATCCYCGTKSALVLRGTTRHELSCASCGAPLHDLKKLPLAKAAKSPKPAKPRKSKKKKSFGRKMMSELFDVVEDIFD